MVPELPTRADQGTMIWAGITPRRARSTHNQVMPLILGESLGQGDRDAGLRKVLDSNRGGGKTVNLQSEEVNARCKSQGGTDRTQEEGCEVRKEGGREF